MGQVKKMWEEAMERGYYADEEIVVCPHCFEEESLQDFIRSRGGKSPCTYCGAVAEGTCMLDELLNHAMDCIRTEWRHPADEGLPCETREGGWQFAEVIGTQELFERVGFYALNDDLQNKINTTVDDDEWCERSPYLLRRDQTLLYGWKEFSTFVMHEARYVFLNATPESYDDSRPDEIHPVKILDALANLAEEIGLIGKIEPETSLYRVHIVDQSESLTSAKRLGSPPLDQALYSNRMSPAGISMFYGALDMNTAILEIFDPCKGNRKKAAYGIFFPVRPLRVLDLSKIPDVPSIFDLAKHNIRPGIMFLHDFLRDFTKPISKDEKAHVEYVPTQVVTEYFRHIFRTATGERLDGIMYPSSKHENQTAVVIFANNDACVEAGDISLPNALLVLRSYGITELVKTLPTTLKKLI
jgi:hypothetical protein